MKNIKIKVCGMTSIQQVQQLAVLGVDYAGFIFYEKSPRFVNHKIDPAKLKSFNSIKKVGVFVNSDEDQILHTINQYGLDAIQLHGDETPDFCGKLKEKTTVVKAFRINGSENISEMIQPYEHVSDFFLFDTKAKEYGGTGMQFDWTVLEKTKIEKPFFLSGGIGPRDALSIKEYAHKNQVFAFDLNSRFETSPGIKNMDLLHDFIKTI